MKFSNPYESKDFKKAVFVPLLLVALSVVSLLFLFPLKPSVELKGGLLLQVQTDDANPDIALLQEKLAPFSEDVAIRSYDSVLGKGIEVEMALSEQLEKAGDALEVLHAYKDEYDLALYAFSVASTPDENGFVDEKNLEAYQVRLDEAEAKVFKQAGEVLSLSGASALSVPSDVSEAVLFAENSFSDSREGFVSRVLAQVKSVVSVKDYSWNEVGSSLSNFFVEKASGAVLLALLVSAVAVFLIFRSLVPFVAVVFGVLADMVITLGLMGVFGIQLSLASIAALLMLIGFSLETDIMLTSRILKRTEGTASQRAFEAMQTGVLMNICTITAFSVLLLLAFFLQISTYYAIGFVVVAGAVADFFATWMFNAVIVLDHAQKRESKEKLSRS